LAIVRNVAYIAFNARHHRLDRRRLDPRRSVDVKGWWIEQIE
jgi:hypothetical protein